MNLINPAVTSRESIVPSPSIFKEDRRASSSDSDIEVEGVNSEAEDVNLKTRDLEKVRGTMESDKRRFDLLRSFPRKKRSLKEEAMQAPLEKIQPSTEKTCDSEQQAMIYRLTQQLEVLEREQNRLGTELKKQGERLKNHENRLGRSDAQRAARQQRNAGSSIFYRMLSWRP